MVMFGDEEEEETTMIMMVVVMMMMKIKMKMKKKKMNIFFINWQVPLVIRAVNLKLCHTRSQK